MIVNKQNTSEYNAKVATLFLEVDYILFQEQATLLIKQYHDETALAQWMLFCNFLNELNENKPVKFPLMQLAFQCFGSDAPLTNSQLAQLITLTQQLKSVYGVGLYRDLLKAKVSESDKQLHHYLTILQILVDLHEVDGIAKQARKYLPDLQALISFLYSAQNDYIASKYPKRNIDEVLKRFATADEITRFPLSMETLMTFKNDYLAIESLLAKVKTLPQAELKDQFLENAKLWRENQLPEAKQLMVAIMADTLRRFYNILPYDTQIISFLAIVNQKSEQFHGRLAQIKAGEGKSTVFAMLLAFKAAQALFVKIVTSSRYLAIRDYKYYKPYLEALGLSSSHISYDEQKQEYFHAQILYGTNSDFEFALLRDGLNKEKLLYSYRLGEDELKPRTFDVIFIDEVDNMLLDTSGAARMAIPGHEDQSWVYKPIQDFIKEVVNNKRINNTMVPELISYLNNKITAKHKPELLKMTDTKLLKWMKSAQTALYQKMENRDYLVEKNIVIVDYANTGRRNEGSQWQNGLHQHLQAKHGLCPTSESLTAASIAHPPFFSKFKEIYGLTGTMGELIEREEILEIYSLDSFDVPPHFPCQRITLPARILPDVSEWNEAILLEIKQMKKAGRPTLPLFESIAESNAFSEFLKSKGLSHQLLNETQRESEDYIVGRAGESGMATIATNTAGRGTDIRLSPESKEAGGLHQIFTFYTENPRVKEQGESRGGRQGQPGSCSMILQAKDSRILSLLATSPLAYGLWNKAESDQEKIALLDQLRIEKIKHESMQRRYTSKLESIYYTYLSKFFIELQALRKNLDSEELQNKLEQVCKSELKPIANLYPVNMKNPHWIAVCRNASVLIANQDLGKPVDWSSFLTQYSDAFAEHILECWATFYSKLSDEVEGKEISEADKIVKQAYEKLNLSAHCTPEMVISTLSNLLYQSIHPLIEKKESTDNYVQARKIDFCSPVLPPLSDDIVVKNIFSFFNSKTVSNTKLVSWNWNIFSNQSKVQISIARNAGNMNEISLIDSEKSVNQL